MKGGSNWSDTRAEYRRILGYFEFRSGAALLKVLVCLGVAAAAAFLPEHPGLGEAGRWSLAISAFAGLLWMSEAMPAFAVALLAIGLQILILGRPGGVLAAEGDSGAWHRYVEPWSSPPMWLFFGGFVLARAASRTGLDHSLAARLLESAGARPERLLFVAMATAFCFSMFLSNTATAAMMLAILAPLASSPTPPAAARALIVGVAFAANLGGMGTIIGTPPNAIASGLLNAAYPIDFLKWMLFGLPPAAVVLVGLWWALKRRVAGVQFALPASVLEGGGSDDGAQAAEQVSRWQRWVLFLVFAATVGLWLTGGWHGIPTAVVSFLPIVVLSVTGVIRAQDIRNLDWDILILLAGGLSLGVGVAESGLANWCAARLGELALHPWALTAAFALLTMVLSNFMSNTAAANILLPVGIAAGSSLGGPSGAAAFAIPMALCASAAMCLPISTPPNAIAYASGRLRARDFLVPGAAVGLAALPLAVLWCQVLLRVLEGE